MTEDQIALMRTAALSVLAEAHAGRSVDPQRLRWAQDVMRAPMAATTLPAADPARTPAFPDTSSLESF